MAQRRSAPKRPTRPARPAKQTRAPKSSGARVSGSVSVSPRFTLFGGSLFSFSFGGGGKGRRGRGKGGLLKRARGFLGLRQLQGKGSGPASSGSRPSGRSFDQFKAERPDLFDDDQDAELGDQGDDQDDAEGGQYVPDHGGQPGGPTTKAHCPACGHPAGGHSYSCEYRGYL